MKNFQHCKKNIDEIFSISRFTVGKIELVFYEICFVKAFLQTLLYSVIKVVSILFKRNHYEETITVEDICTNPNNSKTNSIPEVRLSALISLALWIIIFGISSGAMTVTAYIGVKMIPVSDFVVLGHTAALFTLILSTLILK